jgi:hypothetical protein
MPPAKATIIAVLFLFALAIIGVYGVPFIFLLARFLGWPWGRWRRSRQ